MKITDLRKLVCSLAAVAGLGLSATASHATLFNFGPLSDENGTGTATMDITIAGNVVTAVLDNTSPTTLDDGHTNGDGTTDNAPGIVGFGFNLDPDTLSLASWSLVALESDGVTMTTIGSDAGLAGETWEMTNFLAGISLDYLPQTTSGTSGAIYNPAMIGSSALASLPNYFTTATLTLTFAPGSTPELNTDDEFSPFVRMQNVGVDGDGSLKLPGTPDDGGDDGGDDFGGQDDFDGVPEPATALLGVAGLAALCQRTRRRG